MRINKGTSKEMVIRLFVERECFGSLEYFEVTNRRDLNRRLYSLITKAMEKAQEDGHGRKVGVTIIPKEDCEIEFACGCDLD